MFRILVPSALAITASAFLPVSAQFVAINSVGNEAMASGSVLAPQASKEDAVATELSAMIDAGALAERLEQQAGPVTVEVAKEVYAQAGNTPIWTRRGVRAMGPIADDLFKEGVFVPGTDRERLGALYRDRFGSSDDRTIAAADIELTAIWMRVVSALEGGAAATMHDDEVARALLGAGLLKAAEGDVSAVLEPMTPRHPQYGELRDVLKSYREIRNRGGWNAIVSGDLLEEGDEGPVVIAIRERLAAEGYLPKDGFMGLRLSGDEGEDIFDAELVRAVTKFQQHHGIEADGIVGPSTIEAMNESVESKINRIADTMNRWRLLGDTGERYVWANVPSYTVEGWSKGRQEIAMRTIVGRADRQTPVFSDEVEYVVTNPKWYAPESIVRKDKLPKLAKDPAYAERGNYLVYDRATGDQVSPFTIDWSDPAAAEKYRLVQEAGPGNALGELKIIFPNQYSVYLHGTPDKSLFEKTERAFSSGCIRVEHPEKLARWLARYDGDVEGSEVSRALAEGETERLDFSETTPVHITYMTVTVGDDGQPMFWRDIYQDVEGVDYVEKASPLQTASTASPEAARRKG